jgi:hypothetical protein
MKAIDVKNVGQPPKKIVGGMKQSIMFHGKQIKKYARREMLHSMR